MLDLDKGLETRTSKSKGGSRPPDKPLLFQEIWCRPSTEAYIDGLYKSLQSVSIGSPVRLSIAKRRLSKILDEETVSDETGSETGRTPPPMKKSRVMWHSDSEEDALPSTSQIASSSKKRKKKKKKYKKTKKR